MKHTCPHCGKQSFTPLMKARCGGMSSAGKPCPECGVRCVNGKISLAVHIVLSLIGLVIVIYNYFNSLPNALEESARIDGATEWTVLFRIMLPLAKPVIATVCLFVAVQLWNEYFHSMLFLRRADWHSLQQVLRSVVVDAQVSGTEGLSADSARQTFSEGLKMAAVVVTMVPVVCVYPLLQKYFIKGVTIGAIK